MPTATAAPPLLLPAKERAEGGWRFNIAAMLEAIETLGIERPVQVKFSNGLRRAGAHRDRNGAHVVTVSTYYPGERASITLWHELVHCAQCEQTPDFRAAYNRESRLRGYRANRFEVEAREVAEAFSAEASLTR